MRANREKFLFVDLDRSLVKSDFLFESFVNFFSKNIFAPIISIWFLLNKGKVVISQFQTYLITKKLYSISKIGRKIAMEKSF